MLPCQGWNLVSSDYQTETTRLFVHLFVTLYFNSCFSISTFPFPFILWGYFSTSVTVFLFHLFIIFSVGFLAYFCNHNPFLREHIFVGFNEFPSLVCWCTVIHHHQPQGPTLFWREMGLYMCAVQCVHRNGTYCFKSHPRRLGNAVNPLSEGMVTE